MNSNLLKIICVLLEIKSVISLKTINNYKNNVVKAFVKFSSKNRNYKNLSTIKTTLQVWVKILDEHFITLSHNLNLIYLVH